jgi:hypothetical protein
MDRPGRSWLVCIVIFVAGCGSAPPGPPPSTHSEAAAVASTFFTALAQKDWRAAYATLDELSRAACSEEQFERRAASYYDSLGFEPMHVVIQSCDERGSDEALARVALKGGPETAPRFYRDGVPLRRGPAGWAIVLPETFGQRAVKG